MFKRIFLIFGILTVVSMSVMAQETETLFSGDVEHGGFGGLVLKGSTINGTQALFVGGRGGWIINHTLIVGAGGYGLVTNVEAKVPNAYGDTRLAFGYGGLELEYIHRSDRLIHFTAMVLIGGGGIGYQSDVEEPHGYDYNHPMDVVLVLEPAVLVQLNVAEFFRISAGAGYRHVSGVTTKAASNASLSGGTGMLMLQFGKF